MREQHTTARDAALLIDVREAARRVNLSPATVYALIAKGQFPAKRVGRVLRVPVRALEEWSSPDAV
jgi:excisionase family DNA binding protein